MKFKRVIYFVFFILIFSIIIYFNFKIHNFENSATANDSFFSQENVEKLSDFHNFFIQNFHEFLFSLILIPVFIGGYLAIRLSKKIQKSETSNEKKIENYGMFVKTLNYICDIIINSSELDVIEIIENKKIILIKPVIKDMDICVFNGKTLLGINNLLVDIIRTKYAGKISVIFENNAIRLIKR